MFLKKLFCIILIIFCAYQSCIAYITFCKQTRFHKCKCTLLISVTEQEFSKDFLVIFKKSIINNILLRVERERFISINYLGCSNRYIQSVITSNDLEMLSQIFGIPCSSLKTVLLVQNLNVLKNYKYPKNSVKFCKCSEQNSSPNQAVKLRKKKPTYWKYER